MQMNVVHKFLQLYISFYFFFQAEDGIRDLTVTGVQTCALPISRQREFAIRSALGATKGRMIRQLMVESFLCALAGGAFGLLLGSWLMNILTQAVVSEGGVHGITSKVDASVLGFAALATAASALVFGLLPAWRVARGSVSQVLKDQGSTGSAGPGHLRFRQLLVAGQVAFTVLLLAGGPLFAPNPWELRQTNLGPGPGDFVTV